MLWVWSTRVEYPVQLPLVPSINFLVNIKLVTASVFSSGIVPSKAFFLEKKYITLYIRLPRSGTICHNAVPFVVSSPVPFL
jgi:hypothetical protein